MPADNELSAILNRRQNLNDAIDGGQDVDKKFVSIEGDVEFSQGKSIIRADKINVDLVTETVDFEGIRDSFIEN